MVTQSENTNGTHVEPASDSKAAAVATTNGDANVTADGAEETQKETVPLKQLYEQSTQYNHWRYAQQQLDDMRSKVNQEVVSSIKQNLEHEAELVCFSFLCTCTSCARNIE
jgi:cyclin H